MAIAAAWKTGTSQSHAMPEIYHSTTVEHNPVTWQNILMTTRDLARAKPVEGALWYPTMFLTENEKVGQVFHTFFEYLPALMVDSVGRIFGEKTK
jgi:hypothetical protein